MIFLSPESKRRLAKKPGLTTSFDGNFRSKLWTWEEARDYCTLCLPYVDVLMGIERYPNIKYTIHGDANITDDAGAIKEIMNQNFDIKR